MTETRPRLKTAFDNLVDEVRALTGRVEALEASGISVGAPEVVVDKAKEGFEAYRGRARAREEQRERQEEAKG